MASILTRVAFATVAAVSICASLPARAQTAGKAEEEASAHQIFDEFIGGTLTNCFFKYGPTGADPLNNRAFPDAGAIYWAATYVRPPGAKVEIEGLYPYSRFMSFISYDKAGLYVDGTADHMINPDAGSVNTFRNGAKRYATPESRRKYTVEVRLAEKTAPSGLRAGLAQMTTRPSRICHRVGQAKLLESQCEPVLRTKTGQGDERADDDAASNLTAHDRQ